VRYKEGHASLKVNKLSRGTYHHSKSVMVSSQNVNLLLLKNFKDLEKIVCRSWNSLTLIDVIVSPMCLSSFVVWGLFEYTLFFRFSHR
jgi:hypothetical protein